MRSAPRPWCKPSSSSEPPIHFPAMTHADNHHDQVHIKNLVDHPVGADSNPVGVSSPHLLAPNRPGLVRQLFNGGQDFFFDLRRNLLEIAPCTLGKLYPVASIHRTLGEQQASSRRSG